MLTLIENAEVYAPELLGKNSILCADGKILKIGAVDRRALETLGLEVATIDARGCVAAPGLIDPHQHILGGSGESGFASQTPEIAASEIAAAGITTVVGCLGVDTTMKTLPGLLAKAKGLTEEGLSAFVWSGGYNIPPTTITDSLRSDILFIKEIIGAGEIAIADERSTDPAPRELARAVNDAFVAGMLSNKAGVAHFHVGENSDRLRLLRELIEDFKTPPETLYPTHVERSEELMLEAIELAARGSFVDIDVVEEDLAKWFKFYLDNNGALDKLTVSSDASITSPRNVLAQIRELVLEHNHRLETVLPLATKNTATVLKLKNKGALEPKKDADILILDGKTLELRDVIASGRQLVENGKLIFKEKFLADSNRRVRLDGAKS